MIATRTLITIDPAIYAKKAAKLSHEAKGFWLDLMALGAPAGGVPACEAQLGALMQCDVRKVRRLKAELVKHGILEGRFGVAGAA